MVAALAVVVAGMALLLQTPTPSRPTLNIFRPLVEALAGAG